MEVILKKRYFLLCFRTISIQKNTENTQLFLIVFFEVECVRIRICRYYGSKGQIKRRLMGKRRLL